MLRFGIPTPAAFAGELHTVAGTARDSHPHSPIPPLARPEDPMTPWYTDEQDRQWEV